MNQLLPAAQITASYTAIYRHAGVAFTGISFIPGYGVANFI
jgi:hypothetical protein